jgi:hypothetical protein
LEIGNWLLGLDNSGQPSVESLRLTAHGFDALKRPILGYLQGFYWRQGCLLAAGISRFDLSSLWKSLIPKYGMGLFFYLLNFLDPGLLYFV